MKRKSRMRRRNRQSKIHSLHTMKSWSKMRRRICRAYMMRSWKCKTMRRAHISSAL
jgi:hypothetical protein